MHDTHFKIESLLSARLFLSPQLVGDRIFFLSDMSGRLSLYAMDRGGSVPEPLLPPDIALMTPTLLGGEAFCVFPKLGKALLMIDRNGDENYQPHFVPIDGGVPELVFGDRFAGQQLVCQHCDTERNIAIFNVDPRTDPLQNTFLVDLATLATTDLGSSLYGNFYEGANEDYSQIVLGDGYTQGDEAIFLWERGKGERRLLFGVPIEQRAEGQIVPLNSIQSVCFTPGSKDGPGIVFFTSLFDDRYGLGYFPLSDPAAIRPVEIIGTVHTGAGEIGHFEHLTGDRYLVGYNIDGCSWMYEGTFDEARLRMTLDRVICGQGALAQGL